MQPAVFLRWWKIVAVNCQINRSAEELIWSEEMTLILCLFILFQNNRMFLNLLQQQNVAVVDGLVVSKDIVSFEQLGPDWQDLTLVSSPIDKI